MSDSEFYKHINEKYIDTNYSSVAHYETTEVRDSKKRLLLRQDLRLILDLLLRIQNQELLLSPVKPVSFLDIETKKNNDKRKIFLLRKQYIDKLLLSFDEVITYNRQSNQYIDKNTKSASRLIS